MSKALAVEGGPPSPQPISPGYRIRDLPLSIESAGTGGSDSEMTPVLEGHLSMEGNIHVMLSSEWV